MFPATNPVVSATGCFTNRQGNGRAPQNAQERLRRTETTFSSHNNPKPEIDSRQRYENFLDGLIQISNGVFSQKDKEASLAGW